MARRYNGFYSMEEDLDDPNYEAFNETIPLDDYSEDSETVDVSNISTKQSAHNEAASAGGVVTGSNSDDLEMDPVTGAESLIFRRFGLSREDLDEANEQTIAEGNAILSADPAGDSTTEEDAVGMTTVTVIPPEGGSTSISDNGVAPAIEDPLTQIAGDGEEVDTSIETPSDVASIENLRYIMSLEDDEGGSADVEFDVKTPNNDVNMQMEGKAITIEPNADGGTTTEYDGGGEYEEGGERPTEESEGGEEPPAEGDQPPEENQNPEAGEESWFWFN